MRTQKKVFFYDYYWKRVNNKIYILFNSISRRRIRKMKRKTNELHPTASKRDYMTNDEDSCFLLILLRYRRMTNIGVIINDQKNFPSFVILTVKLCRIFVFVYIRNVFEMNSHSHPHHQRREGFETTSREKSIFFISTCSYWKEEKNARSN